MTNFTGIIANNNAFSLTDGALSLARLLLQVAIILVVCRAISYPFKFFRQPRVIAEVIGGILLGPTALGRWTWFSQTIFPSSSVATLNLLANLGLLLFLLLMGLELDLSIVAKRARTSLSISLTGICLTFAISTGISRFFFLYIPGLADTVDYPRLLIFIGVAMSVTALPVLARILTERNLLHTPVGVTVISAAAVDDAVGWTALALVIALVSAATPLTGIYILLTVIAFALFMLIVMRPVLLRTYQYFSSLHNQNANRESETISRPMVIVSFMTCLIASFFTSAVGIHPIFGAFLTGLCLPRENGFAMKFSEKIEELVSVVLLPLYFTYSGLNTNIGAINSGMAGLSLVLVVLGCMTGKIGGCTIAARLNGLSWRESFAVGILMDTKGLVEIIILNIGLQSGLINDQAFAIMVLLAIFTTLVTTPAISVIYPERFYAPMLAAKQSDDTQSPLEDHRRLLLCLPNTSSLTTMMNLVHFVSGASTRKTPSNSPWISLHAVRLRSLTDRMSALIMAASSEVHAMADPSMTAFQMFGRIRGFMIHPHLVISEARNYAKEIARVAYESQSDIIVIPWKVRRSETTVTEAEPHGTPSELSSPPRPTWVADVFPSDSKSNGKSAVILPSEYETKKETDAVLRETATADLAAQLLQRARVKVAVLVDRSEADLTISPSLFPEGSAPSILVPFFGGPDDRSALLFALRLSTLPHVIVTILHIRALFKIPGEANAGINERRKSGIPGVTRLRRRMFHGSKSQVVEDQPTLPEGFKVDPVDPEDARLLDMVLQYSGPIQSVPIESGAAATSSAPDEAVPEVKTEGDDVDAPMSSTGILPPPAGSIPFRRVATATSVAEIDEREVEPSSSANNIGQSLGVGPNGAPMGSTLRRPSVADIGGIPAVRLGTATSNKTLESLNGSGAVASPAAAGAVESGAFARPNIHLTEVAAVSPLAALMQALQTPEARRITLIAFGHFGPSWHAVNHGGDHGTVHNTTAAGAAQESSYWHEHTVSGMAGIVRPQSIGGIEERVLGPTGAEILRTGAVRRTNLLSVRKFLAGPKAKSA
ncbi:K(+)/H(+) antiporter [Cladochytrium tenue]|nr:K(+)/H(+) antiporter [Cladochytrium tenue]